MQNDARKGFIIAFILLSIAVVVFAALSIWSYNRYTTQVDTNEQQISAAVSEAENNLENKLRAEFTEEQKEPFRVFKAPAELSGIEVGYPKSWSGYFDQEGSGAEELSVIVHPEEVEADSKSVFYAFQLRLVDSTYDTVLNSYDKQLDEGELTAKPYSLPSVQGSVGIQLTGQIEKEVNGSVILIKVRDKTIVASTESGSFLSDFEEIMNEHVTYLP